MTADLDVINAAIAAGDRAIPPVGSVVVVKLINGQSVAFSISVMRDVDGMVYGMVCGHTKKKQWVSVPVSQFFYRFIKIISIPSDSPPFDEWRRFQ